MARIASARRITILAEVPVVRPKVFTGRGLLRSGFDMFVVGLGVAAVGYVVGDLVSRWLRL